MYVVETDEAQHLGYLKLVEGEIHVTSGSAGHPAVVRVDELISIVPADEHEHVEPYPSALPSTSPLL